MKRNLIKIINCYGIKKQLKGFQEEIFNLNDAIIRYQESNRNPIDLIINTLEPMIVHIGNRKPIDKLEDIKKSIAGITINLKEIQYYYGISDDEIISMMKANIKEQMSQIRKESNDGKNISK